MIKIHPRVGDLELAHQAGQVSPATIGHFIHSGFMSPDIKPLFRNVKVCGPAFTVRTPANDSTLVHKSIDLVEPGDIIVIDRMGDKVHACVGEVVALAAKEKGVAAIVIDGPATDSCEITEMGIPVFSTGLSVVTTKLLGLAGEINGTIQCGGAVVNPGDLVFADDNGVLVMNPQEAPYLIEKARISEEREVGTKERIAAGESLADITGADALLDGQVAKMILKQRGVG